MLILGAAGKEAAQRFKNQVLYVGCRSACKLRLRLSQSTGASYQNHRVCHHYRNVQQHFERKIQTTPPSGEQHVVLFAVSVSSDSSFLHNHQWQCSL